MKKELGERRVTYRVLLDLSLFSKTEPLNSPTFFFYLFDDGKLSAF